MVAAAKQNLFQRVRGYRPGYFYYWCNSCSGFLVHGSKSPQATYQTRADGISTQRAGKAGYWIVALDVRVTNIGKTHVSLHDGRVFLKQVNPVPGEDLTDAALKDVQLDPGEVDQSYFKTYEVPDYVHTIEVTSTYGVPGEKSFSWEIESVADIGDGKPDITKPALQWQVLNDSATQSRSRPSILNGQSSSSAD